MVDLKSQYSKIKEEVDQAIRDVLETTSFINGKAVTEFSNHLSAYLHAEHVIPCANGTDALQIALMGLGLQPGDEVLVFADADRREELCSTFEAADPGSSDVS